MLDESECFITLPHVQQTNNPAQMRPTLCLKASAKSTKIADTAAICSTGNTEFHRLDTMIVEMCQLGFPSKYVPTPTGRLLCTL